MIYKKGDWYVLTCDKCGMKRKFTTWGSTFEHALNTGWSRMGSRGGEILHRCPECQDKEVS